MSDKSNLPRPRARGRRPFEMSVSGERHDRALRRAAATASTTPASAARAHAEDDAFRARGHRDAERLPNRDAVAHVGIGQLNRQLARPASGRRVFEVSVSRQRQLLDRRRGRVRCRRRHLGARIGQDAQCINGQRNIECLAGGDSAMRVGEDALHAQLRIVLADQAAGESVGITAVGFNPDFHSEFLALLDDGLHQVHIFGREILGLHPLRVVDHVNAAAIGVDAFDVRDDALLTLRAAPNGPVNGPVFFGRLGKRGGRLGHRRHGDFTPRLGGAERRTCKQGEHRDAWIPGSKTGHHGETVYKVAERDE